ncbi:LysM peptidoglycan-binding domain-containing protein [Methylophilus sp. Leaf408]|uniref:LysM peptidoglycan-binding domain-containing protein n=1 Tax=Methylophilus sp. Leaf408 TaxID=2876561 RepID=UPI001E3E08FA|nr:LysM peptidoglycan-binding domain-containing protein [Methylophilus sp. Leaf408]
MVAIVTGNGVGLGKSSSEVLGQGGQLGLGQLPGAAGAAYVNASNGNLIIQRQDELLIGRGPDIGVYQTYNSQGSLDFDNNDNWQVSLYRQLSGHTGSYNTAGSTVTRTGADGSPLVYTYDSTTGSATLGKYVNKDGSGSFDTLTYTSGTNTWVWQDGDSRIKESYAVDPNDSSKWRITSVTDLDNNSLTYTYSTVSGLTSLIDKVTSANGEITQLIYNSSKQLTQINVINSSNVTTTRILYTYESTATTARLTAVSTDLTPADSSIADGKTYTTTYTYDGTSKRIASITNSDGSKVSFTYESSGSFRLLTISDYVTNSSTINNTTTLSYASATTTTVTNTNNAGTSLVTTLTYDTNKQLTNIQGPSGSGQNVSYTYNTNGDVTQVTDSRGNWTKYTYDAQGNQLTQQDNLGNTIVRTYDSTATGFNQLLTQTVYTAVDATPGDATIAGNGTTQTTRYTYDSKNHVRFTISAEGRVTEYRYNAQGQLSSTHQYTDNLFTNTGNQTEALINNWLTAAIKSKSQRTDYLYDSRGQLREQIVYTNVDATAGSEGNGIADGTQMRTQYVYDQSGNLVQKIDARGVASTTTNDYLTSYSYDGLNRLTVTKQYDFTGLEARSVSTVTAYNEGSRQVTLTLANGLVTTSTYDLAGRLMSVQKTDASATNLGTVSYAYDNQNNLRTVTDELGNITYYLYDSANRKVGEIDENKNLTEWVYNNNGQVIRSIQYNSPVTATLSAATALTNTLTTSGVRIKDAANDRVAHKLYDAAGRLAKEIDGLGAVTEYIYDGASRLLKTIAYANSLNTTQLNALNAATGEILPTDSNTIPAADSTNDRISRNLYNKDGLLISTIDAENYYTRYDYDAAGRKTRTVKYAGQVQIAGVASLDSGIIPQVVTAALASGANTLYVITDNVTARSSTKDIVTDYIYNAASQLTGMVDSEGYLTLYAYDYAGNDFAVMRFANRMVGTLTANTLPQILESAGTGNYVVRSPEDQYLVTEYDANNRLVTKSDQAGLNTIYEYDSVGNLVTTRQFYSNLNQADHRIERRQYDSRGNLIAELSPVGVAALNLLGASPTQPQIDSIWNSYGTRYSYDIAGRLISKIEPNGLDAAGNRTLYYYDKEGKLIYTINALGEVSQTVYNSFDQVAETRRYNTRIASATLAGLTGGADTAVASAITGINAGGYSNIQLGYDKLGQLISTTDELTNVNSRTYNAFGELNNRTDKIDGSTNVLTSYQYDRKGLLKTTTEDSAGINRITSAIYDAFGRVTQTIDGRNTLTKYSYDRLGRTVTTTDALSQNTTVTYDAFDRKVSLLDARGNTTSWSYNATNRTMTMTTPENISVVTTRNTFGEVVQVTDGRGGITSYQYNTDGQLTQTVEHSGSGKLNITTENIYDKAGRVYQTKDAKGTITQYNWDPINRVLSKTVDPSGLNLATRYRYDAQGRQIWTQDAKNIWTRMDYDKKGQLTKVTIDPTSVPTNDANGVITGSVANAAGLSLVTSYTYDARGKKLTVIEGDGTTSARTTKYGYDKLGRLTSSIVDPGTNKLNLTTSYTYDKNDNVVLKTDANGNKTVYTYDANDRLVYTVDPLGYITKNEYDANGNISTKTAYATPLAAAALSSLQTNVAASAQSNAAVTIAPATTLTDQVTQYGYDKDNRLVNETLGYGSANAVTTHYDYDANGNQVKVTVGYNLATPADLSNARITQQVFDAANRKIAAIDALGNRTETTYDATDNITSIKDALGNLGYYYYDAAGRTVLQVNPDGAVTQNSYDALGNLTQSLRYANRIQTIGTATLGTATIPQIVSAAPTSGNSVYVLSDANKDEKQTTAYDSLNRKLNIKTWIGATSSNVATDYYSESFSYDALGNALSTTARNGATTTYSYDAAGRKLTEVLPVTTRNAANSGNIAVSNTFTYDAFGNLLTKVEADGALTTRTTTYVNDKLGRQQQTTQSVQTTTGVSAPAITQKTYDARGNLTSEKDANNNWTYTYYDQQDRRTASVKADGSYTTWTYDALGNISQQTQYANKIQVSGTGTLSATSSIQLVTTAPGGNAVYLLTDATNDRSILYTYDKVGRQTGTEIQNITTGVYNTASSQYQVSTGSITTKTEYDALGNIIKQTDGNGNVTRSWYNKAGQIVAKLDAEGYVTIWDRDMYGNISRETRYANKVQLSGTATLDSSVPVPVDVAPEGNSVYVVRKATDDRITNIVYDKLNRVSTETINNVQAGSVNATTGVLTAASSTNVTTSYQYDGLNNVIQKTDATSAVKNWEYDGLGRELSVINPQFNDFEGYAVRTRTDKEYDGLSNVTREIRRGRDNAVETDDQITTYTYGVGGRLISETDAAGAVIQYEYDLNGNVIKQVQKDRRNANQTAAGTGVDDVTTYTYDSLSRQVKTTDQGTTVVQEVQYNNFNQVTGKRTYTTSVNPTSWDEYSQYDQAGRVWKSNSGEGVTKVYINDKNGNATAAISGTLDMRNMTLAQVVNQRSLDSQSNVAQQTMYTYSVYDKKNQAITTVQPNMDVDSNNSVKTGTLQIPSKSSLLNWSYSSNNRFVVDMTQNDGIAWLIGMHTLSTSINIADTSYLGSGNLKLEMIYVDIGQNVQFDSVVKYLDSSGGAFNYSGYYNSERGSGGYDSTLYLLKGSWRFPDTPAMSVKIRLTKETAQGQIQLFNEVVYTDDIRSQLETDNYWIENWEARPEFNSSANGVGSNAKVIYISNQPPSSSKLLLSYRPTGSTGAYTTISVPQMLNSAGAAMSGMYAFDWSTLGAGEYEFQYVALDSNGQILNQQSGTFNTTFAASGGGVSLNPANNISYNPPNAFTQIGNSLKKTGGTNGVWTDAGVFSQIGYTGSAYLTARAGQTNLHAMIGLNSDPMTDRNYTSLDYAWYPAADGKLYIYENGANVVAAGYGTYLPSDVLEISYQGTTVNYLKNGTVIRSVTTTAGRTLYMDSSFYNTGYVFDEVRFGSNAASATDIVLNNDTALVKTGGSNGGAWDADAFSKVGYTGSAYVSARAGQTNLYAMIGLNSDPMTDKSYTSLDYAWYPAADGKLYIYENGANVVAAGFGAYLPSDVLAVEYQGTTVNYLKNGTVIRSVTTTAGRTLYMDSSFLHTGYIFNDVKFGSNASSAAAVVLNNDNSIVKTGANGVWDADVYTTLGYTANAYVSARAGQTNLYGMFGLNSDPMTDKSYTSLDYAWYPAADGNLYIYESGTQLNGFGAYTPSDVLAIEYQGTTIKYFKNGTVIRTATTTANRTFYLDSSFHNTGYRLNDIKFGSNAATATALLFAPSISVQAPLAIGGIGRALFTNTSVAGMSSGLQLIDQGADATSVVTRYRLKSSGGSWITPSTSFVANSSFGIGSFVLDPTGLSGMSNSNDYEVQFDIKNSSGVVLRTVTATINKDSSGALSIGSLANVTVYITSPGNNEINRSQAYNAFGEIVSETDGRGNVTSYTYNTMGAMTKKTAPTVSVTAENGAQSNTPPVTEYTYDAAGRVIAIKDANGNVNTQVWLTGVTGSESVVLEKHADGGIKSVGYDIFGNKRTEYDELATSRTTASADAIHRIDYTYDQENRLTRIDRQARANGTRSYDEYGYDAAGNRISHTTSSDVTNVTQIDNTRQIEKTYYDSLGRVTKTSSFMGFETNYAYTYVSNIIGVGSATVAGWQKTTTDAVGRALVDKTDMFNHVTWHQDLGGHQFTYVYNQAGWLTSQTSLGAGSQYSGQNIVYSYYNNGNIKSIHDKALGMYTYYEYDKDGNRTFEGYISLKDASNFAAGAKDYYQYANISYDAMNRMISIVDSKARINYEYDAVGNRRMVKSEYYDGVTGSKQTQEYWYKYDSMNRFLISMGTFTGTRGSGSIGLGVTGTMSSPNQNTAVSISYNQAGQRKQALYASNNGTESYTYTNDGYLTDVKINNVLRSSRTNDGLGRVTTYNEYATNGTTVNYTKTTSYDKDNRVTKDTGTDGTTDYFYHTNNTDNTSAAVATGAGQLARVQNVKGGTTVNTYYAYEYWDEAKQLAISNQGYNPTLKKNNAFWKPGYSDLKYDVNGHLAGANDAGADGNRGSADDRSFRYVTDAQGLILLRDEIAGTSVNRVQRFYYVNGKRVGDVGNDGPGRTDYVQAMAGRGVSKTEYKNFKPVSSADFDQNYEPVSPGYPGFAATSYTVKSGETLQSIAQAVWGDSAMWYLIADANGLASNSELVAGQVLTIPNKITNVHNNSSTYRVYNPGEAIGDINPTLPTAPPPPKKKKKCGGFAQLIVAIVTIAVSVVATATLGPIGGAVVGNLAGQVTGNVLGVQKGFDFKSFATAVVTAGITDGLMGASAANPSGVIGKAIQSGLGSTTAAIAARAVVGNVIGQGVGNITGSQKGFNWASVAAAGAGAAAGSSIGVKVGGAFFDQTANSISKTGQFITAASQGLASSVAGQLTQIALDGKGKLSWANVAISGVSAGVGALAGYYNPKDGGKVAKADSVFTGQRINVAGDNNDLQLEDVVVTAKRPNPVDTLVGQTADRLMQIDRLTQSLPRAEVRAMTPMESFSTFNPVGVRLKGLANIGNNLVGGVGSTITGLYNIASDAQAFVSGSQRSVITGKFEPSSGLIQPFQNGTLLQNSANIVGGTVTATLRAPFDLADGLRYGNADKIGSGGASLLGIVGGKLTLANPSRYATFGVALTSDYKATFFTAHPELKGQVVVHHAVEQQVLTKFPGVVSNTEIHSLENLRGIPHEINNKVHLSEIRVEWNRFYKPFIANGTSPTQAQLLEKATQIDAKYGSQFNPPIGGGNR